MFNEFKKSMEEELDFTYEYRNAENIRINLPEKVSIPGYEPSLCTKSILTQLYAQGVHIRELTSEKTKQEVIDTLGNMLINQFINTGVFLDDLHPGNIRVIPLTGEIELLDFGRTGYTNEAERSSLIPLLMAIKTKSVKDVVNILHIVSPEPNGFDRVGLEEALEKIMKEENMKTSMIISRVFFECSNHGLAVNPVYLRMLKGVMTFEGTAMQLNPNFNFESFI
jgi:predicted unusual protein kinase regulating ubiquinone biosynthesis (AarF/ABC1/UbiB family)